MKKSKNSSEELQDRLTDLPDSLIFEIFGLLPMRVVVRTTVLSKRWRNRWTITPYLNFYDHAPEFVNRALLLWKGCRILKFKFSPHSVLNKLVFRDIDAWVRLCRENGIQEFYFNNWYETSDVLQNLHSCASLKVLSLQGYFSIDQNLIDKVISGSPQLEVFILEILNGDDNLSICSTSLKKLSIERHDDCDPSTTELRIWSPNLETLHLGGFIYAKYSLTNVSSLTHLTLDFSFYEYIVDDLVGEVFGQILPAIQHVEKLTLSRWCSKVLGDMKEIYLLSPLSNCKFLTINSKAEYEKIVDLLQIFPKLETLVFQSDYYSHDSSFLPDEINLPKSFLLQLKTVEITCIDIEDEHLMFTFIEFLLKHASKLQKMVIRVQGIKPPQIPWLWAQKLLRMPRSSPTAELIFA